MIPEPWPIPPVRSPLEMEAGFLNSDVQKRDEVASERSAFSMGCPDQVSECREGIRTLLLRDSAYNGWRWRHFRSSCRERRGATSTCPLAGGPSGTAHHSVSCAVVFIEIAADLVTAGHCLRSSR